MLSIATVRRKATWALKRNARKSGDGSVHASLVVSRLLNTERELNQICIPYQIGYPRISNSRISINPARHYLALHVWQARREKKGQMEQRVLVRFLTLKGVNVQEIGRKLTSMDGDEALQISPGEKW
jgi:hypothetical protein